MMVKSESSIMASCAGFIECGPVPAAIVIFLGFAATLGCIGMLLYVCTIILVGIFRVYLLVYSMIYQVFRWFAYAITDCFTSSRVPSEPFLAHTSMVDTDSDIELGTTLSVN